MRCAILLFAFTCGVLAAPIEDEAVREFITGNQLFSTEVYKEMKKYERGNFVACPISVETVLALTHEGARGDTAAELESGLYLPNTAQKTQYAFQTFLPSMQRSDGSLKFFSANKIYAGANVQVQDKFSNIARTVYYSGIGNVNFSQSEKAAEAINNWVAENTNNKIRDLVNPMNLNEDTKLVLVNSIYFNGAWVHQFNPEHTEEKMFHQSPDVNIKVPTMNQIEYFNYYDHPSLEAQFLELPYTGGNISMVIVLPHEERELSELEENVEQLMEPQPFQIRKINVELPKFKTETEIKFVPILKNMGIKKAFRRSADFSGISSTHNELMISDVLQKALISIDENGAEAAAATSVTASAQSGVYDPTKPINFKANRPFMYYIINNGVVIFFGRVSEFAPKY